MIKKNILNLFSIKRSAKNYEISQFIRKLYYRLVPFILSIFFITIFFWPSIYTTYNIKSINTINNINIINIIDTIPNTINGIVIPPKPAPAIKIESAFPLFF